MELFHVPDGSQGSHVHETRTHVGHFFRMFVDENTYMLDPTCGSVTALRAAEAHKAAYVLAFEINEEFAKRADLRLWEARRKRSEESVLEELVGTL